MRWWLWSLLLLAGSGCQTLTEVDGITLGGTLTEQQDYQTNQHLAQLVTKSLHHDRQALVELLDFECGGAAGCYDLGEIITQLAYRIGEKDFTQMIAPFSLKQKYAVRNFLEVGVEYGTLPPHSTPTRTVARQFPYLSRYLPH